MAEILLYLAVINLLTYLIFWHDKRVAMYGGWRIPEKTLLLMSLLGGSPAAIFASKILRHKTKKQPFKGLLYLTVLMQIICIAIFSNNPELLPVFIRKLF